jgi:acetyl esterase/lipase
MLRRVFALPIVIGFVMLYLVVPSRADASIAAIQTSFTAADGVTQNAVTIWTPNTPGQHAALVYVHGGEWDSGDRLEGAPLAEHYAALNYITVGINYRLTMPRWTHEIDDVKAGIAWVKSHAAQFMIDANRIVLVGASAGGNLALLAAAEDVGVLGTVSLSGPTDLNSLATTPGFTTQSALTGYLGCAPTACSATYAAASPVTHLSPTTPPALLVFGNTDMVPFQQGYEYVLDARALNVGATLFIAAGQTCHAMTCLPSAYPKIDSYLASLFTTAA